MLPMVKSSPRTRFDRRGYSLIELVTVIGIVAALSISAVPAMRWMDSSRAAALEIECARMLAVARDMAVATGQPHGVRFDLSAGSLALVRIASASASPTAALDPTGQPARTLQIGARFAGSSITAFVNGDGASTRDTVWFAFDGTPHLRQSGGALVGPFSTDAVVTISGGQTVTIRRLTGAIE